MIFQFSSGGVTGAAAGTLTFMVGGEESTLLEVTVIRRIIDRTLILSFCIMRCHSAAHTAHDGQEHRALRPGGGRRHHQALQQPLPGHLNDRHQRGHGPGRHVQLSLALTCLMAN